MYSSLSLHLYACLFASLKAERPWQGKFIFIIVCGFIFVNVDFLIYFILFCIYYRFILPLIRPAREYRISAAIFAITTLAPAGVPPR